jgi:tyrosyl-tRNA synthetase
MSGYGYTVFDTAIGRCGIAWGGNGVIGVQLPEAREIDTRLVKQGGVELDGTRISDVKHEVELGEPRAFLLRAGKKKFLRILVE